MNKCDLLEKKIESGVGVKSLLSLGDRLNDVASVTKCELSCGLANISRVNANKWMAIDLKTKFKEIS